ncbi:MAG: transglycosylase SLT domain-containing protein [Sideroxydans sp.]|nr:transglycosylase SLT domain-containing protein [Sideroxydans sp.]
MCARNNNLRLMVAALILLPVLAFALPIWACAATIPRAALHYKRDLIRVVHATWGLDAPVAAFAAQIHQESGWNPRAVSYVGAQGMAQFMPATAKWWCDLNHLSAVDCQPANPIWAMRSLVGYDRWLWNRIKAGDERSHTAMALSAYNGGLGWVYRDQKLASAKGADSLTWFDQVETFNAGRSAASFAENRGYPRRILILLQPLYLSWGRGVL